MPVLDLFLAGLGKAEAAAVLDRGACVLRALSPLSTVWISAGIGRHYPSQQRNPGHSTQRRTWTLAAGRNREAKRNGRRCSAPRSPGRDGFNCPFPTAANALSQHGGCALLHFGVRSTGNRRTEEFLGGNASLEDGCRARIGNSGKSAPGARVSAQDVCFNSNLKRETGSIASATRRADALLQAFLPCPSLRAG
jgi:hypothetical protein